MSLTSVCVLMTDFGQYPCPPELSFDGMKLRKDRQPDRRTTAGKDWWHKFGVFSDRKRDEYLASKD